MKDVTKNQPEVSRVWRVPLYRIAAFLTIVFVAVFICIWFFVPSAMQVPLSVAFAAIFGPVLYILWIISPALRTSLLPPEEKQLLEIAGRGSFLGSFEYSFGLAGLWWGLIDSHLFGLRQTFLGISSRGLYLDDMWDAETFIPFANIAVVEKYTDVLRRPAVIIRMQSGKKYWICFRRKQPENFEKFIKAMRDHPAIRMIGLN